MNLKKYQMTSSSRDCPDAFQSRRIPDASREPTQSFEHMFSSSRVNLSFVYIVNVVNGHHRNVNSLHFHKDEPFHIW